MNTDCYVEVFLPIVVVSEANVHEHWAKKAKRVRNQRTAAWAEVSQVKRSILVQAKKGCTITLTRIGGRRMDSDNLARSMKAIRDGIADALKIDDGDMALDWQYSQEPKPKNGEKGVRIRIQLVGTGLDIAESVM